MTNLKAARQKGKIDDFIKEHGDTPGGDLDKIDAMIKRPVRGIAKATPKASTPASSDD